MNIKWNCWWKHTRAPSAVCDTMQPCINFHRIWLSLSLHLSTFSNIQQRNENTFAFYTQPNNSKSIKWTTELWLLNDVSCFLCISFLTVCHVFSFAFAFDLSVEAFLFFIVLTISGVASVVNSNHEQYLLNFLILFSAEKLVIPNWVEVLSLFSSVNSLVQQFSNQHRLQTFD